MQLKRLLPKLLGDESLTFDQMVKFYNTNGVKKKKENYLVLQVSMGQYYDQTLVNQSKKHLSNELANAPEIQSILNDNRSSSRTGNLEEFKR